jgi:hypothetical protein
MIRSRAFNVHLVRFTTHEIATLRVWLNASPTWLLRFAKEKTEVYAYVRFDKLMSLKKIQKMFPKANVETTTAKYTAMIDEYSKLGSFDTKFKYTTDSNCDTDWQKSILDTLAIKGQRGVVRWIDDPYFCVGVSHLIKKLSTLQNVLVIDGFIADSRTKIRQELVVKQRRIDTILWNIPPIKRLDGSYFQVINQLRDGYIADVASDGKGCEYSILNVLVVASCELNKPLMQQMDIVKVQIR